MISRFNIIRMLVFHSKMRQGNGSESEVCDSRGSQRLYCTRLKELYRRYEGKYGVQLT